MYEFDYNFFNSLIKNYEQKWFVFEHSAPVMQKSTVAPNCEPSQPFHNPTIYFYKFHFIVVLNPSYSFWLPLRVLLINYCGNSHVITSLSSIRSSVLPHSSPSSFCSPIYVPTQTTLT